MEYMLATTLPVALLFYTDPENGRNHSLAENSKEVFPKRT